jgi:hypothetical protein
MNSRMSWDRSSRMSWDRSSAFLLGSSVCIDVKSITLTSHHCWSPSDIYLLLGVVILVPSLEQNLTALSVATNFCNNARLLIQHVLFSISWEEKTKPYGSLLHYVRKPHLRCSRTKNRDTQIMCLYRHASHYKSSGTRAPRRISD